MIGRGGDKAARQDLFPTAVAEWRTEERVGSPPIGTGSSFDVVAHPVVRAPARARSASRRASRALDRRVVRPARARGDARREPDRPRRAPRVPRRVQRGRDGRERDRADGDAVVGLVVPARRPARPRRQLANGRTTLRIPPLSAALFRAEADLPRRGAARLRLRVAPDRFTNLVRIAADATSVDPLSVSFAVKRAREEVGENRHGRRRAVRRLRRSARLQARAGGLVRRGRSRERRLGVRRRPSSR